MMRLDLSLIEVFCCVYEECNFSRAAERLNISQPTVSGHIKNLEQYIGTRLFDRLPRQVVPTRAGQLLYQRGCAIIKEKMAALQDLQRFLHRIEGSLIISSSAMLGEYILPRLIASFRAQYPGVRFELKIANPMTICAEVLKGDVELGFACSQTETQGLEFRRFASTDLSLVVPHNKEWRHINSITMDRLAEIPFLARETGAGMRLAVEQKLGRMMDDFNVVGIFESNFAVKEALRAGMGVSVLSLLAVQSEIARGELKTVEIEGADARPIDLFIVVNRNLTLSPAAEAFLDYALKISMQREDIALASQRVA